jgi:hypothetical protein
VSDETGGMTAALRRVTLERDRLQWTVDGLKEQCRSLRRQLRTEQAAHQQTHMRLEALRAQLFGSNTP